MEGELGSSNAHAKRLVRVVLGIGPRGKKKQKKRKRNAKEAKKKALVIKPLWLGALDEHSLRVEAG